VTLINIIIYLHRVGFKIKQSMRDEEIYKDRDSQIAAIEKTFEKAKVPVSVVYHFLLSHSFLIYRGKTSTECRTFEIKMKLKTADIQFDIHPHVRINYLFTHYMPYLL